MSQSAYGLASLPVTEQQQFGQFARSAGFPREEILGPHVDPYTPAGVARALRARGVASVEPVQVKRP